MRRGVSLTSTLSDALSFEDGRRGHDPRNVDGFSKLEEARKWVFP